MVNNRDHESVPPPSRENSGSHQEPNTVAVRFFRFVLKTLPTMLVGSWRPPSWLSWVARTFATSAFGRIILGPFRFGRRLLLRHLGKAIMLSLVMISAPYAYSAYQNWLLTRPGPPVVTATLSTPAPTLLDGKENFSPVNLVFSRSAAPLKNVGKIVSDGLTWQPSIDGQWEWINDATLRFEPAEDWGVDQEYTLSIQTNVISQEVRVTELSHSFRTARLQMALSKIAFYQDPKDPKIKKLVATVQFNHPVNRSSFEKKIGIHLVDPRPGQLKDIKSPLGFSVRYADFGREAYIHSDVIALPKEDKRAELVIGEGVQSARGGRATSTPIKDKIVVPGVYSLFKITNIQAKWINNKNDKPQLVLLVSSSDGIAQKNLEAHFKATVLPIDKPAQPNQVAIKKYAWAAEMVSPADLAAGKPLLKLKADPSVRTHPKRHSIPISANPRRHIFVQVTEGLQSFGGYALPENSEWVVRIPRLPLRLSIAHEGGILPQTGERSLSVVSRGLTEMRINIGRVMDSEINHLVTQTEGDLNHLSFNYGNFSSENITELFSSKRTVQRIDNIQPQYTSVDLTQYGTSSESLGSGLFFVHLTGRGQDHRTVSDKRFILITDLGLIIKKDTSGGWDVFVQSFATGKPVSNVEVIALGRNGRARARMLTGADGHAYFKKLQGYGPDQPIAIVARKRQDVSFLPFDRYERQLNLSRFDVGGVRSKSDKDSLSAFVFSDRGIYRPGETIQFASITRSRKFDQQVQGIHVRTKIRDSRGRNIFKKDLQLPAGGLLEFSVPTHLSSPTGTYVASIHLLRNDNGQQREIRHLGSNTVRVEEFIPDRMKIRTRLSASRKQGWVKPNDLSATVTLENLFGQPAMDRKVTARATLTPAYPSFKDYRSFDFQTPIETNTRRSSSFMLPDQTTNAQGLAIFPVDTSSVASGLWTLRVATNGFEAGGGRSVSASADTFVSPLDSIVGFKADGDLQFIKKNSERNIDFIAINNKLEQIHRKGLSLVIEKEEYISVLTEKDDGTLAYQSERQTQELNRSPLQIQQTGTQVQLSTKKPGKYVLSLQEKDQILLKIHYQVAGEANVSRQREKSAHLDIQLDKSDYDKGDLIQMNIQGSYPGSGLITIEQDGVYSHQWFQSSTTSTVKTIKVPPQLEGNGYVHVTMLRDSKSTDIFVSPFSYGVAPFSVSTKSRTLNIELNHPKRVRPGDELRVQVSANQPSQAIIFGVDTGILQVAGHATPDPINYFFEKKALQVKTWQLMDLLLPDASLSQALSASGGGEPPAAMKVGANLNPFQRNLKAPVTFWSGIQQLTSDQKEIRFKVPDDFNGSLRIMAVATSKNAIGSTQSTTFSRGDIILTPNAPLFASPGDKFEVVVGVSNQIEGSGDKPTKMIVELKPSSHFHVEGASSITVDVAEGREGKVRFQLKAKDELGSGHLSFKATSSHSDPKLHGLYGHAGSSLSMRPAMPFSSTIVTGALAQDSKQISLSSTLYPEFATREVQVGSIPIAVASGLYRYLDTFPFGCTEQVISKSMAAMALHDINGLRIDKAAAQSAFNQTIQTLRFRQTSSGAFGMWAANAATRPHHTIYATHFLVEARDRGWQVDSQLINDSVNYIQSFTRSTAKDLHEARLQAYGLYIMARNGIVVTRQADALLQLAKGAWPSIWKKDVFSVWLAGTYQLLRKRKVANELMDDQTFGLGDTSADYFSDVLSSNMQLLYILSRHFPEKLPGLLDDKTLVRILDPLSKRQYNTLSSAYSIMGLRAYIDAMGFLGNSRSSGATTTPLPLGFIANLGAMEIEGQPAIRISETASPIINQRTSFSPLTMGSGYFPTAQYAEQTRGLSIESRLTSPVFYQVTHSGFERSMPKEPVIRSLEITREYLHNGKPVSRISIGDEVTIRINLRAVGGENPVPDVAIMDLLPTGFAINPADARQDLSQSKTRGKRTDYVDIREDRALIFVTATQNVHTYEYRAKATASGQFVIPPPQAISMYNLSIKARGLPSSIDVDAQ